MRCGIAEFWGITKTSKLCRWQKVHGLVCNSMYYCVSLVHCNRTKMQHDIFILSVNRLCENKCINIVWYVLTFVLVFESCFLICTMTKYFSLVYFKDNYENCKLKAILKDFEAFILAEYIVKIINLDLFRILSLNDFLC